MPMSSPKVFPISARRLLYPSLLKTTVRGRPRKLIHAISPNVYVPPIRVKTSAEPSEPDLRSVAIWDFAVQWLDWLVLLYIIRPCCPEPATEIALLLRRNGRLGRGSGTPAGLSNSQVTDGCFSLRWSTLVRFVVMLVETLKS
jgi:hypothetical protein